MCCQYDERLKGQVNTDVRFERVFAINNSPVVYNKQQELEKHRLLISPMPVDWRQTCAGSN